jgi:D-arginine dehydrogenase
MVPELARGRAQHGLFVPAAGVVDPHAICTALERACKALFGELRLRTRALSLRREGGHVVGVELDGDGLHCDRVVLAAGAWAREVAERAQLALPLTPIRRHLALLETSMRVAPDQATVWDVELETYFRPESGAVLASPCDETPWSAGVPPRDPAALELLALRLALLAPALSDARVRTSWACLRTFAPDRALVAGPDPRVQGLHWVAGLGGFGMSTGLALGALAAAQITGDSPSWADALLPDRLSDTGDPSAAGPGLDFATEERLT